MTLGSLPVMLNLFQHLSSPGPMSFHLMRLHYFGVKLEYLFENEKEQCLTNHSSGWLTATADFCR